MSGDNFVTSLLDWFGEMEEHIPGIRSTVGEIIFGEIPLSDAGDVYELAEAWGRLASELSGAFEEIAGAADGILEAWQGDGTAVAFAQQWQEYLAALRSTVESAYAMEQGVQAFGNEVELMKFMAALNLLMLAISIYMIIAALIPSCGGSLGALPGVLGTAQIAIRTAVSKTIGAIGNIIIRAILKTLTMAFGRALPILTRAVVPTAMRELAGAALTRIIPAFVRDLARRIFTRGIARSVANRLAADALRRLSAKEMAALARGAGERVVARVAGRSLRAVQSALAREIEHQLTQKFTGRVLTESAERAASAEIRRLAEAQVARATLGRELAGYVGTRMAFGAGIMGGGNLFMQLSQVQAGNRTSLDWGQVWQGAGSGAAFGAGMWGGPLGHAIGGAAAGAGVAAGQEAYSHYALGQDFNWTNVGRGAVQGGAMGLLAGGQTRLETARFTHGIRIGEDVQLLRTDRGLAVFATDHAGTRVAMTEGGNLYFERPSETGIHRGWTKGFARETGIDVETFRPPRPDMPTDHPTPPADHIRALPPAHEAPERIGERPSAGPDRVPPQRAPEPVRDAHPAGPDHTPSAGPDRVPPQRAPEPVRDAHPAGPDHSPTGGDHPTRDPHHESTPQVGDHGHDGHALSKADHAGGGDGGHNPEAFVDTATDHGHSAHPLEGAGAEMGVDPSPESIRQGTVRMTDHPDFPAVRDELAANGFSIVEKEWVRDAAPRVAIWRIVGADGQIRFDRHVEVLKGMRFLDLEHELGHVRQVTDPSRFPEGPPNSEVYRERPDGTLKEMKNASDKLPEWKNTIVEYHERLEEFIRLAERGVDRQILEAHASGVDQFREEYLANGLREGRSRTQADWRRDSFPDIPAMERRVAELRTELDMDRPGWPQGRHGGLLSKVDGSDLVGDRTPGDSHLLSKAGGPRSHLVRAELGQQIAELIEGRPEAAAGQDHVPYRATWDPNTDVLTVHYADGVASEVIVRVSTRLPAGEPVVVRPPMERIDGAWHQTGPAGVVIPAHLLEDSASPRHAIADQLDHAWQRLHDELRPPHGSETETLADLEGDDSFTPSINDGVSFRGRPVEPAPPHITQAWVDKILENRHTPERLAAWVRQHLAVADADGTYTPRPQDEIDRTVVEHRAETTQLLATLSEPMAQAPPGDGRPLPESWGIAEFPRTLADDDPLLIPTDTIVTEEREAFRQGIVDKIIGDARPPTDGPPRAYVMGGGGASGKGVVLDLLRDNGRVPRDNVVNLNPDDIKEYEIPRYAEIVDAGDSRAAAVVHEESSDVAKRILKTAIENRLNIVYDVTMGQWRKAVEFIERFHAAGYEVDAFGVTADADVAVIRNAERAARTHRYVPIDMQLHAHRGFSEGFLAYADLADHVVLYDTNGPKPLAIAAKTSEGLVILDPGRFAAFLHKAELNPHATGPADLYPPPTRVEPPDIHPSRAQYTNHAMDNLSHTSRTAGGVVDTSASADKAAQMAAALSPDQAARLAVDNYRGVVDHLYASRDRVFNSPEDLRIFVEDVVQRVNAGITRPDALYRLHDSEKFASYTKVADLPEAARDFFAEFHARLADPTADPVETAAWVEYRMDLTDHLWADGCGKSAKAVAAWVLMRHGYDLPTYPEQRAAQFAHAPRLPRSAGPGVDAVQFREWLHYYTSLFGSNDG